jgi:hypothetical protein
MREGEKGINVIVALIMAVGYCLIFWVMVGLVVVSLIR